MVTVTARIAPTFVLRIEALRYGRHAHRVARNVWRCHLADLDYLLQEVGVSVQPLDFLLLVVLGLEQ